MADPQYDKTMIKKGNVRVKGRIPIGKSWKKKMLVLYGPSSNGAARLVKYSGEQAFAEDEPSSQIPLKDVGSALRCKMSEGSHGDGITLHMSDRSIKQFLCDTELESTEWLTAIQAELTRNDNLPSGMFRVFLLPCATLNDSGECILYVTSDCVYIYDNEQKNKQITACDITHIRRYGADAKRKQFLIEAGSKNPTGEGIYLFRTVFNQEIHDQIEEAAERIKKKVAGRQRSVPTIPAKQPIYMNQKP